jgi:two-component system chemotaxis response regulator CheB
MSEAGSIRRDIVVVGGVGGGVEAMIGLFEKLPADLPAALAVVIHRHPERASQLVDVLDRHSALRSPSRAALMSSNWATSSWGPRTITC